MKDNMNTEQLEIKFNQLINKVLELSVSSEFYTQCGMIILAIFIAFLLAKTLKTYTPILNKKPVAGPLFAVRKNIYAMGNLLFPLFCILALEVLSDLSGMLVQQSWLLLIAESLAVVFLLYTIISRFIKKRLVRAFFKWIIIPIALLQVFGFLDEVTTYLDTIKMEVGNIRISAYGVMRLLVFGVILFWLGRISSNIGKQIIRNQEDLDLGTREVFAKLFQVTLFLVIFILLLQLIGINFTALAVFGGALGVGLGFGLQSIASNFISGIIILLDRSITVGDYIELEDGRTGMIRELNMRSAILETFDGKDIMVPNEQFITTNFVNWTHKNNKQRYPLEFSVAYNTDLNKLFKIVREVVASHPQVLSGDDVPIEERPDAEIMNFGDSGINILVEFWMEDIDDGKNKVGADLLHMIWNALKENNIEIPYPQREVKILNPKD
ncbi:MAG: small-conductance mechanosensitive channel [Gammaproteobacteria bacterium]